MLEQSKACHQEPHSLPVHAHPESRNHQLRHEKSHPARFQEGQAGVGKSDYARYLVSWWVETNFGKIAVYLNASRPTFDEKLATASTRRDEKARAVDASLLYLVHFIYSIM
jgi:hypothetical protein